MDPKFRETCVEVMNAGTVSDLSRQVLAFIEGLGFLRMAVSVITDHSGSLTEFRTITNSPVEFLSSFHDLELAKRDPVSQHCKFRSSPIIWDQETYTACDLGNLWDHQASFGYKSGIALAMHYQGGRHFMIGANGDYDFARYPGEARRIIQEFKIFSAHAQAAAFDLCLPPLTFADPFTSLSARELEALRWTMDGRTARGIGTAMATSEEIASTRLDSAMRKLGCGSKYEAVLKAIRLGLIRCE